MLLQKTALLFLCFNLNIADEDNKFFWKKFIQHDYDVKDFRLGDVSYNPKMIEDFSAVYRKHNRTAKALNTTLLTKVDFTKENTIMQIEVLKRFDNQYKRFGVRFSNSFCTIIQHNLMGFGTYNCGRFTCPIMKKQRQSYWNWTPDFSQLPPYVPEGDYNIQCNTTYQDQFAFFIEYFDEGNNSLLKKFIQHDYEVKDLRLGDVFYNPEIIEDYSSVYRKYNRTTKALNTTILTKVDLTIDNTMVKVEVLKRFDNQYKPFGLQFSNNFCRIIQHNLMGFGTYNCGKLSCPIVKKQRQSYCNWTPDFSQLPPYVPDGDYKIRCNVTCENQFAFYFEYFGTVYRKSTDLRLLMFTDLSTLYVAKMWFKTFIQSTFSLSKRFHVTMASVMEKARIIPDVLDVGPQYGMSVVYDGGLEVSCGNEFTPKQVKDCPLVKFNGNETCYYTLMMINPDVPSRGNPFLREWQHWIVVNILGSCVSEGDTLSQYVGAIPQKGAGLQRYVFFVFQQQQRCYFNEPRLDNKSTCNRDKFSTRIFATKYNLGIPLFGNFFQAQFDDYVTTLNKQLDIK
ncbi:hypothetical protein FQR65_LT10775 [Abscondita terminalis]|nr:hypothetical protein FQR65_LT10775 [Abscondita terminalis]